MLRSRWRGRYLMLLCVTWCILALAACSPVGARQSVASQHTLAHDGGTRLTLHAACLPDAPACDLTKQRDAAVRILAQRLAGRTDISNPVVRADGSANIIVELPGATGETQVADITTLLTTSGAIAILDTGDTLLPIGANTAGQTCASSCDSGQYRIVFTGDQIARNQIAARVDVASGKWVVQFGFAGSAKQQFAEYTASHIGQSLTITMNDVVIASPTIQSEIDGSGQITGLSETEAKQLAAYLESGTLPVSVTVVTTELVTPSAGS